jgi:hypothetical protein
MGIPGAYFQEMKPQLLSIHIKLMSKLTMLDVEIQKWIGMWTVCPTSQTSS